MEFKRYECFWKHTWAYFLFKDNHTQLNQMYWASVPATASVRITIKSVPDQTLVNSILPISTADSHRINWEVSDWKKHLGEYENWTRLNCVMAMSAYFELMLSRLICLTLESDPCLRYGKSKAVDGVVFLKANTTYGFADEAERCTKGDWNERLANFKSIFGEPPKLILDSTGELEKIRKIRNAVGHSFGIESALEDKMDFSLAHVRHRVSQDRLKTWLGLLDELADKMDSFFKGYIGAYEAIRFFHFLKLRSKRANSDVLKIKTRKEIAKIPRVTSPGKNYVKGLVAYYDSI